MPEKKKPAPKKRSIIMDTLFGREDDPATPEDESNAPSILEGAKNFLFGKKALVTAGQTQEERRKAKEKAAKAAKK